jgi:hypothetical protein
MKVLRLIRLALTALYSVALIPAMFLGWAAYSDYGFRGCPGEGIGQCSDAVTTMQIMFSFLIFGGLLCLALWALERKMVPTKVESNA